MQVIIPMTGYGSRFVAAGYQQLKPFIAVNGKPIIEWIVKGMFPEKAHFLFICRQEHLELHKGMEEYLHSLAPMADIISLEKWEKKGPVFDVMKAQDHIDESESCIINYCDFYMDWNYPAFIKEAQERGCDGSVPCYTGFHPHLLIDKNVYASCQIDNEQNLVEIKEKFSWEKNKLKSLHSPGLYYFKNGFLLKKYCQRLIDEGDTLAGEYYASLPYNYMVRDGLTVWVPANVRKFCQWGTPEDLEDYLFWIDAVKRGGQRQ